MAATLRPMSRLPTPAPDVPTDLSWRARHRNFLLGVRDMAGLAPGMAAWSLVTGVAMVKAGLGVPLALLMSFTVYAGSAQLAALPLLTAHAPFWVIWATAACVNLRFVVFSLQWRPYLMQLPLLRRATIGYFSTDMSYGLFMRRFPAPAPGPGQRQYLVGLASANWVVWQAAAVAGIVLVDTVPAHWGLGFAGVLALLGLGLSLVSDRAMALSALVAGAAAVATVGLPLKLNIVVAIVAAVAAGALQEAVEGARQRAVSRRSGDSTGRADVP